MDKYSAQDFPDGSEREVLDPSELCGGTCHSQGCACPLFSDTHLLGFFGSKICVPLPSDRDASENLCCPETPDLGVS